MLLRRNGRLVVVVLFGLVHGLGFAEVLRALGPDAVRAAPLALFNLGVELGQISVAIVLWAVILMAGRSSYCRQNLRPALVAGAGAVGVFWLVTRSVVWFNA